MKYLLLGTLILCIVSCSKQQNKLDKKAEIVPIKFNEEIDSAKYLIDKEELTGEIKTLDVSYGAVMCTCPQWFESKYAGDTINDINYFYLEPANSNLVNADTIFNGEYLPIRIIVTGQFYTKTGYPLNYFPTKGDPKPSKVFRYNNIKIIQRGKSL